MEPRGQIIIKKPMSQLGFNPFELGVCDGFFSAFMQFALDGRMNYFIKLIDFIFKTPDLSDKIKKFKRNFEMQQYIADIQGLKGEARIQFLQISAEEQLFVEAINLFEMITTFQEPKRKGLSKAISYQEKSKLFESKTLQAKGGLKEIFVDEMIFTVSEWCNYLEELRVIMESEQSDENHLIIAVELVCEVLDHKTDSVSNHTIGLFYDHKEKYWSYADINLLPYVPHLCDNLAEKDSHIIGIDEAHLKTMHPGAIRNGNVIRIIKLLYFEKDNFIPAKIKIFTTGMNPRLTEISRKLDTLKQSQLLYCPLSELGSRQTKEKRSLIHLAAQNNDPTKINQLIKSKANINRKDNMSSAFHYAASYNSKDVMRILLNSEESKKHLNQPTDNEGSTPALLAANNDNAECLDMLATAGADLNLKRNDSYRPIHFAAQENSINAMQVLLKPEYKIELDQTIDRGDTALCIAATNNHPKIIELLFDRGANPLIARKDGYTAFHMAVQEGSLNAADVLIKKCKVNINQVLPDGRTAVHIATDQNRLNVLLYLAHHHADMSLADHKGLTAMHYAAHFGFIDVVKLLLKHKVSVLQKDITDHSAIYYAITRKHYEITLLMLLTINNIEQLSLEDKRLIASERHPLLSFLTRELSSIGYDNIEMLKQRIHLVSNPKEERLFNPKQIVKYGAAAMFGIFGVNLLLGRESSQGMPCSSVAKTFKS